VDVVKKQLRTQFDIAPKERCTTAVRPMGERDLSSRPGAPMIEGLVYTWDDVTCALEQEMSLTIANVLDRRTYITWEVRDNGVGIAPQVAERMAAYLGWDKVRREAELRAYADQISRANGFRR
jgi:glycerol-3-phosphate dehydrogenase